eukprot:TRINITY_DN18467_c0_g2_i1.p1 TRINITY_DN18467_c0_g2~~TRINITY_DN18467_c0_g2_i1.p1  ORF type:complete len:620 (-),score=93.88 TRINITY_DN18467_c0_g2_i1:274-2133(-)
MSRVASPLHGCVRSGTGTLDAEADIYDEPKRSRMSWIFARSSLCESWTFDDESRSTVVLTLMVIDGYAWLFMMSITVLIDFGLMCSDIDNRAAVRPTPVWTTICSAACLVVYFSDFFARLYCEGKAVFLSHLNSLDFSLLILGVLDMFSELLFGSTQSGVQMLRLMRLLRLCRLTKLFRLVRYFTTLKELKKLTMMLASCFKTLVGSMLLGLLMMYVWAAVAVEFINPVVIRLADRGVWSGCSRCGDSFSSVAAANLTLFQTIVAGDSWGLIAIPVIEEAPETCIIFVFALFTIVYGLLQLIVCVIVDSFAELRERDLASRVDESEQLEASEKRALKRIFKAIDTDRNGTVSFDELLNGSKQVPELGQRLRLMDISKTDLEQLFEMLDVDHSGEVDAFEFIDVFYRMMSTDSKSAAVFLKESAREIRKRQQTCEAMLQAVLVTSEQFHEAILKMNSIHDVNVDSIGIRSSKESTLRKCLAADVEACAVRQCGSSPSSAIPKENSIRMDGQRCADRLHPVDFDSEGVASINLSMTLPPRLHEDDHTMCEDRGHNGSGSCHADPLNGREEHPEVTQVSCQTRLYTQCDDCDTVHDDVDMSLRQSPRPSFLPKDLPPRTRTR